MRCLPCVCGTGVLLDTAEVVAVQRASPAARCGPRQISPTVHDPSAQREHRPAAGHALELAALPRSSKSRPAPTTVPKTVPEQSTSPAPASALTRAAMWTAMPPTSSPMISHSPVCSPTRTSTPSSATVASTIARAQRSASDGGPSKVTRKESPTVLTSWPPKRAISRADALVVGVEQVAPARVAQPRGVHRRVDDVGEEHRQQRAPRLAPRAAARSGTPRSPAAAPRCRRPSRGCRCPGARRSARRGSARPRSGCGGRRSAGRRRGAGSSVGTRIVASRSRTSKSALTRTSVLQGPTGSSTGAPGAPATCACARRRRRWAPSPRG